MSLGCKHGPVACEECIAASSSGGNVAFLESDLTPVGGESLAQFIDRSNETPGSARYVEPTSEQIKEMIHDETIPETVRRYWRQRRYGAGGGGRKDVQQQRLQAQANSLQENLKTRAIESLKKKAGTHVEGVRPKEMSGRQWKRTKRLMRRMAKVVASVEGSIPH